MLPCQRDTEPRAYVSAQQQHECRHGQQDTPDDPSSSCRGHGRNCSVRPDNSANSASTFGIHLVSLPWLDAGRGSTIIDRMEPLVFEPFLKPVVWGGRRLGSLLNKHLPTDAAYGESWELSPHPVHVSRVAEGPLAGRSLTDLCRDSASEVFGSGAADVRFPLLIKLLDCRQLLSIQVHPHDELAQQFAGEQFGKTEAWIVLEAEPGAVIYAGLKAGVQRPDVERLLATGRLEEGIHSYQPQAGDCVFLPAGTIHAVGGGVVMAEVQQACDATFRLYDWNRVGTDGRPRELHIEQALASIDWTAGPVQPVVPRELESTEEVTRELCVDCRHFRLERVHLAQHGSWKENAGPTIWMVLSGEAHLQTSTGYARPFQRGETVLIPASSQNPTWSATAEVTLLRITLPA